MRSAIPAKPAEFVGTAEDDLAAFPNDVKSVLGFAIFQAQIGGRHKRAKPLKGHKEFKGRWRYGGSPTGRSTLCDSPE